MTKVFRSPRRGFPDLSSVILSFVIADEPKASPEALTR
jgi:hypothetical protein